MRYKLNIVLILRIFWHIPDFHFQDSWLVYLHIQLWVWSNVSGWGGNWSPHTVVTSGWTYFNQFCGVWLYIVLLGEIVNMLQKFDLGAAEFKSKRDKISTFLQLRQVPSQMQQRVHSCLWVLSSCLLSYESCLLSMSRVSYL